MCSFFSFISGSIFGAYVAQNYDIMNVKKTGEHIINYLRSLEKDPNKKDK